KYRKNHRDLEKGLSAINRASEELNSATDQIQAIDIIDKLIGYLKNASKKIESVCEEEKELNSDAKERLNHLKELSVADEKTSRNSEKIWKKEEPETKKEEKVEKEKIEPLTASDQKAHVSRFYRLLSDHLFITGHINSAIDLAKTGPASHLSLIDIYSECARIKEALLNGDTSPAHAWYQESQYKLKKTDCVFEFELRIFEFYLLLVKENKRFEALDHARKYIGSSISSKGYKATKMGQAMVLFAMRDKASAEVKAQENELTEEWIVGRFHQVFLAFYEFTQPTALSTAIKAGATAIKTLYCYNDATKQVDCVVCHPLINKMAKNLPYGRHENSVLNCQITNRPINENNPAMMLPNGHVYSKQGLMHLLSKDLTITCPRTGDTFELSSAERVYIL
ncbi:hypothetical protein Ciccas_013920, partial [Cichlidogyrus casuarinus]